MENFTNNFIYDRYRGAYIQLVFYGNTYVSLVVQDALVKERVREKRERVFFDSVRLFYQIICATMRSC